MKRKAKSLHGHFNPESGAFSYLDVLRDRFMALAFELEPALESSLAELYETSLKGNSVWLTLSDTIVQLVDDTWPRPGCAHGDVSPPSRDSLELARKTLEPWVLQHNLGDSWSIDWIIDQKLLHRHAVERGAVGITVKMWVAPAPLRPIPFAIQFDSWRPDEEGRSAYERRIQECFRRTLARYLDEVEQLATAAGYVRMTDRPQIDEHLKWLVRYQVKGQKPAEIWKSLKQRRSRRAVEKAIRDTAALLRLTMRAQGL